MASFGSAQTFNYRNKKRKPWDWMIQGQADDRMATKNIMSKMRQDLDQSRRDQDVNMWQKDFNLKQKELDLATKGAKAAMGGQATQLGLGIMDKFGGRGAGSFSIGGGSGDWMGSLGNVASGASIGYGLSNIFGSGSKKNQKWATGLGGLAGLFF